MKTKLSTYFISLTTAIVLISAVIPVLPAQGIINVPEIIEKVTDVVQINEAQAAQGGPSDFQLGIRDLGCSAQERTSYPIQYPSPPGTSPGYITDTNQKDPDCVRIKMEAGNTSLVNGAMYTSDFRLGIRLAESESGCTRDQGSIQWTPWASEGGGVSPTARPNTNVVAADCVWIFYQTRNHPNPAVRIENARTGISVGWGALAYTPWASAGGGWSNWSTTSNDFITARVALDVQLNYKYNADFVSTTIPQYPPSSIPVNSAVPSNIVMRNIPDVGATSAMPWSSDQIVSSSTDRGVSYCYQWTPSGPGQNCTQTTVYTSTKFKLRRIDGHIAAVETPAGDLEYRRTVVSNFTSYPQYAEICITEYPEHDGGGGEGPQLPGPIINDAGGTKFKNLVQRYLGIPKAQADHSILTCTIDEGTINGYYAGYQGQNQPQDVVTNQTADFPISVTGLIAGQYQLQFRMINTETGEMFGDPNAPGNSNTIARINVNVGQSWLLNCGVDQIVTQGEVATYMISATGNPGGSVSVTMSSNPAGPTMTNSPLVLSSAAYTGIANVATAGVAIGNYTLTFTGAVGGSTMQCPSNLTIVPDWGTVELFFDGSPGPTTPTPPEGDSGELTWTTQGSIDFCTPSMVQGDAGDWSGQGDLPASGAIPVSKLEQGQTYIFQIECVTPGGNPVLPATVQVEVGVSQIPTATLLCMGDEAKSPHSGPCEVSYNSAAQLTWSSTYASTCGITPGTWPTTTSGSGNTPNLTSNFVDYTLSCTGPGGVSSPSTLRINVIRNENYTFTLSSNYDSVPQGTISATNLLVFNPIDGFNSPVTMSANNVSPAGLPIGNITFKGNPLSSPYSSSVVAEINTTGVPIGNYTITFRSNGGVASDPKTQNFVVNVFQAVAPQPPQNPGIAQGVCGQVIVSWNAHASHNNTIEYRVYRRVNGTSDWGTAITTIPYTTPGGYTYQDNNIPAGSYEYRISSSVGSTGSPAYTAIQGPIVPTPCEASLSGSYKRIVGSGSSPSAYSACGNSLSAELPNDMIYKAGDTVFFEICVRSSGTLALNNVVITEDLVRSLNIENIQYVSSSTNCASGSGSGPYPINISGNPPGVMNPGQTCSVLLRAIISNPGGPSATLHRFTNFARVSSLQVSLDMNSAPELFSIGGGVPTRTETAP